MNHSQNQIRIKIIDVTPDMARKFLNKIELNNRYIPSVVQSYARDMKNGQWTLNNDIICVADDGQLLNGRQRLSAIVMSNTTQKMTFGFGYSKGTFGNMDIGKNRNAKDTLRLQYGLNVDLYKTADINLIGSTLLGMKRKITPYEQKCIYEYFSREIETVNGFKESGKASARIRVACEIALKIHSLPVETVERFFEVVTTGYSVGENENKAIACKNALDNSPEYSNSRAYREKAVIMIITQIEDFCRGLKGKRVTPIRTIDFSEIRKKTNI